MVKHSLWRMLEKYPYFMDKRRISNLYNVTDVNNSVFRDLYNSLFHTYESFHLNKRLLIWKTQDKPYDYKINFKCGYPNIKTVQIYKNDELIHQESFTEDEKKTDYSWTYECGYIKTNMLPIKVYRCTNCNTIYFGDELPTHCDECGHSTYVTTNMYQCDECKEIYFANPENDNEIVVCDNNCDSTFTKVYAYKCTGKKHNVDEYTEDVEGVGYTNVDEEDCGEIYISAEPPEVCEVCGTVNEGNVGEVYYNDDTIIILDNSTNYNIVEQVEMDEDIEINPIDTSILTSDKKVFVKVIDYAGNPLPNTEVTLYSPFTNYDEITNEKGMATFNSILPLKYNKVSVHKEGYVSRYGDLVTYYDINLDENEDYCITITLFKSSVWDKLNTYDDADEDIVIRETFLENVDSDEALRLPFPIVPDDKFILYVETWDEYWVSKGFPENDVYLENVFDHDYSLDEIGALNDIPRKKYTLVTERADYPLTEPPYNKCLTEDDYHYMKRMIEYNLRLWVSLNILQESDENYGNYIDLLNQIGISKEEYELYKKNPREFREKYNPVTLELWKNYGVDSTLINREKYLLKLFDLRKHNKNYSLYNYDEQDNTLIRNDNYKYRDNWDVVTDLSECWLPKVWEHKDKFCEGGRLYKTYFFVEAETLRPLPYENVECKFHLLNSIWEDVEEDYYVVLEYYRGDENEIKEVNGKKLFGGYCNISYKLLNNTKPTTVRFNAYGTDDDVLIGSTDITFNPRNSCNADIYVDVNSTESIEDGTNEYPFKSLQVALNKVNKNFNLICLKSDVTINEPLFVPNSCRILGVRERNVNGDCDIEKNVMKVPVITNTSNKKFFNLIGGKNCELKLVDLRLNYNVLSSYIGLGTWMNTNVKLDDYETVIIQGGLAKLIITLNKKEYFPWDTVKMNVKVVNKHDQLIPNQTVDLLFNKTERTSLTDSDGAGTMDYVLRIHNVDMNIYELIVSLNSEIHFNTSVKVKINCTKEPLFFVASNSPVTIESENHSPEENINVYVDGEYVEMITTDENGIITYEFQPELDYWGVNYIVFTDDSEDTVEMAVIESKLPLTTLLNQKFIKNLEINAETGEVTYDELIITENTVMGDLEDIIIDAKIEDHILKTSTYHVKNSRAGDNNVSAKEGLELKDAVIDVVYKSNDDIEITRLGEFWED